MARRGQPPFNGASLHVNDRDTPVVLFLSMGIGYLPGWDGQGWGATIAILTRIEESPSSNGQTAR